MYLPIDDLKYLSISLPEEVKMYHYSGDFVGEIGCIDRRLSRPISLGLKKRLEIQRFFASLLINDYSLDFDAFLARVNERYPHVTKEDLSSLVLKGDIDFILKGGEKYFQHQAVSNLFYVHSNDLGALNDPSFVPVDLSHSDIEHISEMKRDGYLAYRYEVEEKITIEPCAVREGETLRLWFPFPVACESQPASEIKLISSSHPVNITGDVHRTAFMEVPCKAGEEYTVRFSYVNRAPYVDLSRKPSRMSAKKRLTDREILHYTSEVFPHIRFTPYICELAEEIRGDETDPLVLAKRVYDRICTDVKYSYVRDYLLIDNIPEYVLINGYGDCGTMSLAFITLCRALGIPAKWQSGSYCDTESISSHDWCMFYVEPYGWLYCDPSYAVGAVRRKNEIRREHYFGNIDPYRLVASNEFQNTLIPDKLLCRKDPYDNQVGEAEYKDGVHNLFFGDFVFSRRVIKGERVYDSDISNN